MDEKFFQPIEEKIRVIHNINSENVMTCPHFHDHYEIHFTLSYNVKFIIEDTIYYVPRGSIFAIQRFVPHITAVPDDAWFERYTVHIKPEIMEIRDRLSGSFPAAGRLSGLLYETEKRGDTCSGRDIEPGGGQLKRKLL